MPQNITPKPVPSIERRGYQPLGRAQDGYQPTRSLDKSNPPRGRSVDPRPATPAPVKKTAKG